MSELGVAAVAEKPAPSPEVEFSDDEMAFFMFGEANPDDITEKLESRQETIQRLVEHFGDQLFEWGSHPASTIAVVIDLCPVIGMTVDDGFDAVVAMVGSFAVDQPTVKAESAEDDEDALSEELAIEGTDEIGLPTTVPENTETKAAMIDSQVGVESKVADSMAATTISAATVDQTVDDKNVVAGDGEIETIVKTEAADTIEPIGVVDDRNTQPQVATENSLSEEVVATVAAVVMAPVVQLTQYRENTEQVSAENVNAGPESIGHEEREADNITVENTELTPLPVILRANEGMAVDPIVSNELNVSPVEYSDIIQTVIDDEPVKMYDMTLPLVVAPAAEYHFDAEERVDQAVPVIPDVSDISDFDVLPEVIEHVEHEHSIDDTVIELVALIGHAPESYEIDTDKETIGSQLQVVVRRIEKLQSAETAEQCRQQIKELKAELAQLLLSLGYLDNDVERLAAELIRKHPAASLLDILRHIGDMAGNGDRMKRQMIATDQPLAERVTLLGRHVVGMLHIPYMKIAA